MGARLLCMLCVLWPGFLIGGVLEMLVFSMVDPTDLQLPTSWELPRIAIYTLGFFCFWALASASSYLTARLIQTAPAMSSADGGDRIPRLSD